MEFYDQFYNFNFMIEVYDQSERNCIVNKEIRIQNPMLRFILAMNILL